MATERLDIVVSENGSRVVKRNLEEVAGAGRGVASAVGMLKAALASIGIGLAVNELLHLADSYAELRNQIRLVSDSTEELDAVTRRIFQLSQATRTQFGQNAAVYNDLVQATQNLSFTSGELLDIQETLNKVVAQGQGDFAASVGIINSLILKMQDGSVESREFRQVLTQIPDLADVLAKAFNKSIPEIVKDVEEGRLGLEEFLRAIQRSAGAVDETFGKITELVPEAVTKVINSLTFALGRIDEEFGTTEGLVGWLNGLAEAIDNVTPTLITFGHEFETFGTNFKALLKEMGTDVDSFGTNLDRDIRSWIDLWDNYAAAVRTAVLVIKDIFGEGIDWKHFWGGDGGGRKAGDDPVDIGETFRRFKSQGLGAALDKSNINFSQRFRGFGEGLDTVKGDGSGSGGLVNDKVIEQLKKEQSELDKLMGSIDSVAGAKLQLADAERILDREESKGAITVEERNRLLTLYRHQLADTLDPVAALTGELDKQIGLIGMSNREQTIQNQLEDIRQKLLQAGIELDDKQTQLLRDKLGTIVDLTEAQERYNVELQKEQAILDQINGPAQGYADTVRMLNDLLEDGRITAEQHFNAMRDALIGYLDAQSEAGAGIARGLLKLQKEYTDFASVAEGAVREAFKGAEDAIVQFAKTGKFEFSNFVDGLIEDIIRLQLRAFFGQVLTGITNSLIGAFGNGGDTPEALGTVGEPGSAPGFGFHSGRGPGEFHQTRILARMLASALPRHHSGVGPGEHAAMIRNDESVLTPGQMKMLGDMAGSKVNVSIYENSSNTQVTTEERENQFGEKELRVMIDDVTSKNLAQRGTRTESVLRYRYSARNRLATR